MTLHPPPPPPPPPKKKSTKCCWLVIIAFCSDAMGVLDSSSQDDDEVKCKSLLWSLIWLSAFQHGTIACAAITYEFFMDTTQDIWCIHYITNKFSTRQVTHSGLLHPYQPYYKPSVPFTVSFITGNISVCMGCKNKYPKSPKPPQDLCIRHEKWRQFTPPNSSTPQSKFGNVYYHCRKECIAHTSLQMIFTSLTSTHKEMLLAEFWLSMDWSHPTFCLHSYSTCDCTFTRKTIIWTFMFPQW